MKRWVALSLGLLAALLVTFVLLRQRDPEARRAARDTSREVSALRDEVEALKQHRIAASRVVYVPSTPKPAEQPVNAQAAHDQEHPSAEPETEEALREREKERRRETVTKLEARFANERVDGDWSTKTVRQIRDVFDAGTPGTRLLDADCASSLCRVLVSHESTGVQRALADAVSAVEPFVAGVLYDYDQESTPPTTTLFVLREGRTFRDESESP